jgi:hypothetical protein
MVGAVLAMGLCGWAWAQDAKPEPVTETRTYFFKNVSQPNDGNEIQTAVRNLLPPAAKIFFVPSRNMLIVAATPEQLALVQRIITALDTPKKAYRLTYGITEMDGGKKLGAQHFALEVQDGQRVTLKEGSKVPIATGSPDGKGLNFQYLDVGMNFDATLTGTEGGGVLKTKVEQSGVAEEKSGVGPQDPVVRQSTFEGTAVLTMGKPAMLGSLDVPGSSRHLDIEVTMEPVK